MRYSLSVVQLCPDTYRDIVNAIAEAAGYGPNNLSVELRHSDGSTWWGCHAWWIPEVLVTQMTLPPEAPNEWHTALAAVITSTRDGGSAYEHWVETLNANGLSVVQEETLV